MDTKVETFDSSDPISDVMTRQAIAFDKPKIKQFHRKVIELNPALLEKGLELKLLEDSRIHVFFYPKRVTVGLRFSHLGQRVSKKLCQLDDLPKRQILNLAEQKIAQEKARIDAYAQGRMKFQEFALEVYPSCISNQKDYKGKLNRLNQIVAYFGDFYLDEITVEQNQRLLDDLSSGRKPATVNRFRSLLSSIFTEAQRMGYVKRNPARLTRFNNENNNRSRRLSDREFRFATDFLINEINSGQQYPAHPLCLLLALFSGMRLGELLKLQWDMYDPVSQVLTVPDTKNGDTLTVHLNSGGQWVIDKCREIQNLFGSSVYLFPSFSDPKKSISRPTSCLERLQGAMRAAGVLEGHFTIHDLRRTYGSRLLAATNGDIRAVQQSLGHRSSVTTERYAYHESSRLKDVSALAFNTMGVRL